jgi:hypothetical protein
MIVNCAKCGAQNFIGEERLRKSDVSPPKCWVCFSVLPPVEESSVEEDESNNLTIEH